MKLMADYTIVVRPDSNGTFVAYIPAIPGCHAWVKTTDEAGAELVNVFEMIREEYSEQKLPLPENVELVIYFILQGDSENLQTVEFAVFLFQVAHKWLNF